MKLSWGISLLFYASACAALLVSLWEGKAWKQVGFRDFKGKIGSLIGSLVVAVFFAVSALVLQLDISGAWPYLIGGAGLFGLLGCLNFSSEHRAFLLLIAIFTLCMQFSDLTALSIPLLAAFLGLAIGKIWNQDGWTDFLLPAGWIVGVYWLVSSTPETSQPMQIALLTCLLSAGLLARLLQVFPLVKKSAPWLRAIYTMVTGALLAWLAVQNFLLEPTLMPWIGLFAGALLLGFILPEPLPVKDSTNAAAPGAWQMGAIALALLGIATLVTSRLFGTLGLAVLAVGLLANRRAGSLVSVAVLFLLGRVMLQAFLAQYNSNVTGINIMHPYASAALYLGFALMLLLPGWLNRWFADAGASSTEASRLSDTNLMEIAGEARQTSAQGQVMFFPLSLGLFSLGPILLAGLSSYFLHAEATASLLLALLVSGVGVSLLTTFSQAYNRHLPLFLSLLTLSGALAAPEVLTWGNEAEKSQKLIVLSVALVVVLLAGFLAQRLGLGRKPVQVS